MATVGSTHVPPLTLVVTASYVGAATSVAELCRTEPRTSTSPSVTGIPAAVALTATTSSYPAGKTAPAASSPCSTSPNSAKSGSPSTGRLPDPATTTTSCATTSRTAAASSAVGDTCRETLATPMRSRSALAATQRRPAATRDVSMPTSPSSGWLRS